MRTNAVTGLWPHGNREAGAVRPMPPACSETSTDILLLNKPQIHFTLQPSLMSSARSTLFTVLQGDNLEKERQAKRSEVFLCMAHLNLNQVRTQRRKPPIFFSGVYRVSLSTHLFPCRVPSSVSCIFHISYNPSLLLQKGSSQ